MVGDWLAELRARVQAWPGTGSTLVVAVSGGGDSVALLHGLASLREPLGLRLIVAHLDHGLRPDSAADAAFVGDLALQLGIQCIRERQEVGALVRDHGGNLEEVARRARYGMLEQVATAVGAHAVALAHTADDQAETVLMHLLRGAGLDGLKGMTTVSRSPISGATTPLFRPLLMVERQVIRHWLHERRLRWREDPTNVDTARFRNRLRHEIIPFLEQEQPRLRRQLAQMARVLAGDHMLIETHTGVAWQQVASVHPEAVQLDRDAFLALPVALQRRLVRRAFFHLRPSSRDISYEQVEQAIEIAERGESGARATLPEQLFLIVAQDGLWIGEAAGTSAALQLSTTVTLPEEGAVEVEGLAVEVSSVGREAMPENWAELPRTLALLDKRALERPLQVRPPLPDDRWAPLGMGGQTVGLRDWMARRKVPLAQRARIPLLVDATGRILWVVGWEVSETARVRPGSAELLRITVARAVPED